MLTQPDRFDVALLHLDRPVFYQVLFFFYNPIMKQKYKPNPKTKIYPLFNNQYLKFSNLTTF